MDTTLTPHRDLSTQEAAFLEAILEGKGPDQARSLAGLDATKAAEVIHSEIENLRSRARNGSVHKNGESTAAASTRAGETEMSTADDEGSVVEPVMVRISPFAFLRTMANALWTTLRYPTRTTEIDLTTGRVLRNY